MCARQPYTGFETSAIWKRPPVPDTSENVLAVKTLYIYCIIMLCISLCLRRFKPTAPQPSLFFKLIASLDRSTADARISKQKQKNPIKQRQARDK